MGVGWGVARAWIGGEYWGILSRRGMEIVDVWCLGGFSARGCPLGGELERLSTLDLGTTGACCGEIPVKECDLGGYCNMGSCLEVGMAAGVGGVGGRQGLRIVDIVGAGDD